MKKQKVVIFDSQAYSEQALTRLEQLLGKRFAEILKGTRKNVSMRSLGEVKLSDAFWVELALREICDFDFQIFEQAV